MSSLEIFIQWFKEYYSHEYKKLSVEFKNEIIEAVIINNGDYISKDFVENNIDLCDRCGRCCREQYPECEHFDNETNLCKIHGHQPWSICSDYPYGTLGMIAPLTLNCKYIVRIFIKFFNEVFSKQVNLNE